jgi:hypothetical protein
MNKLLTLLIILIVLQPAGAQKRTPVADRSKIKAQTTTGTQPKSFREDKRSTTGILAAEAATPVSSGSADRQYWSGLAYRMAAPVLEKMSRGELVRDMTLEVTPTWDNRNIRVAYMEAFARLMTGIAPWLALPGDDSSEGKQRKQLREWALLSYKNAVDPGSPDYLLWKGEGQILVDAAFLAQSFIRAPQALWDPLDTVTKQRYIEAFQGLRSISPAYSNWILFRGMIEAFFIMAGEPYDAYAVDVTIRKMNEWYLSDGFYSDGTEFAIDYYNAYVIHPMYVEILEVLKEKKISSPVRFELALERMQRYNQFIERLISPEGSFPVFGRSITYRMGSFQTLALSSWKYGLPEGMTYGQVRSGLTAVMQRMFSVPGNFNDDGYLTLGFAGHQPDLANSYTNNGSVYLTSVVFLPLGLPASHAFWTEPGEDWTSRKAWSGKPFPMDKHVSLNR